MLLLLALGGVEIPRKYGSYVTAWRLLRRLQEAGVWGRIIEFLTSMSCRRVAITIC
jgi:hypothetical protein